MEGKKCPLDTQSLQVPQKKMLSTTGSKELEKFLSNQVILYIFHQTAFPLGKGERLF